MFLVGPPGMALVAAQGSVSFARFAGRSLEMHQPPNSICHFQRKLRVQAQRKSCGPAAPPSIATASINQFTSRGSNCGILGFQTTVSLKSESAFSGAQLLYKKKMGAAASSSSSSRPSPVVTNASGDTSQQTDFKSVSEEEWKKRLNQQQFYVARKKGTERAFSGEYWNTKTAGTYLCVCCKTPLFSSSTKFDSGTGWPSYYEYVGGNVKSHMDWTIPFMPRTEVVCAACDAHLGHVFSDGPKPTGKRYCINSASLDFKPEERK